jgi:hypothetical protein
MTDVVIMIWSRITTCKRCIEVINGKMALERCRIEDILVSQHLYLRNNKRELL